MGRTHMTQNGNHSADVTFATGDKTQYPRTAILSDHLNHFISVFTLDQTPCPVYFPGPM